MDKRDIPVLSADAFFTADTHINAIRTFELMRRKRFFNTMHQSTLKMFESFGELPKESELFHLGDIGEDNAVKILISRHPNTSLILGNYEVREMEEKKMSFEEYSEYLKKTYRFKNVYEKYYIVKSPIAIGPDDNKVFPYIVMIHDPYEFVEMKEVFESMLPGEQIYCLFGHIHGRQMIKPFGLDVGVDIHGFKPIPFSDANFFLNSLQCGYYDHSVWTQG